MDENAIKKALKGQTPVVEEPETLPSSTDSENVNTSETSLAQWLPILLALNSIRQHLKVAPTASTLVPKKFIDQIQFYDDGTNRRVYFWINNTWRYVALT